MARASRRNPSPETDAYDLGHALGRQVAEQAWRADLGSRERYERVLEAEVPLRLRVSPIVDRFVMGLGRFPDRRARWGAFMRGVHAAMAEAIARHHPPRRTITQRLFGMRANPGKVVVLSVAPVPEEPGFWSFRWGRRNFRPGLGFAGGGMGIPLGRLTTEQVEAKIARMVAGAEKLGLQVRVVRAGARRNPAAAGEARPGLAGFIGRLRPTDRIVALEDPLDLDRLRAHLASMRQRVGPKPRGLWYACGDEWLQWTASNAPERFAGYRHLYRLMLDPARMLRIKDEEGLRALDRESGVDVGENPRLRLRMVDWQRVAARRSGIEICPWIYTLRDEIEWYAPWDVAGGCIWDADAIRGIEELRP
jgi:hypothetical protein